MTHAAATPGAGLPLTLTRTSAAEQVADHLTRLILEGSLGAGERLRESSLAQSLGISRNSVREGIRLLEQGRLVRYEMHRGAVVATPSLDDLDDLYRTRIHLETLAAQSPVTSEHRAELEAAYDALVRAAQSGQAREIVFADLHFHATIVAGLGSARMSAFFETITTEMGYYLLILSHTDDEPAHAEDVVIAQHRQLLDGLLTADPAAVAALRQHLEMNHRRIREILITQE